MGHLTWFLSLLLLLGSTLANGACGPPSSRWSSHVIGRTEYCYYTDTGLMRTWHEANQWCISQNGELASITSAGEQNFLVNTRAGLTSVWIGLHNRDPTKPGEFTWTDNSTYKGHYTNWPHGAPVGNLDDACVEMDNRGYWMATDCAMQRGTVCKRLAANALPDEADHDNHTMINTTTLCGGWYEHSGFCYQYFSGRVTWTSARSRCFKAGGYLIDILSQHEQEFVNAFAQQLHVHSFWMGLNSRLNSSVFVWDDGTLRGHTLSTDASALNWGLYEPNNRYSNEHCTETQAYPSLVWNDVRCNTVRSYVCKRRMSTTGTYTDITPAKPTTCPGGYKMYAHPNGAIYCYQRRGSSYRLLSQKSWSNAAKDCEDSGETLLSIGDHLEGNFVRTHLLSSFFYSYTRVWIGMTSVGYGHYRWRDGSPVSFTSWSRYMSRPSRYQQCAYIYRYSSKWQMGRCTARNQYICKLTLRKPDDRSGPKPAIHKYCQRGWHSHNGFCYFVNPTRAGNHATAVAECSKKGGKLASIHSLAEQAAVSSFLESYQVANSRLDAFIGLTDVKYEGEYVWDDGSNVDYTFWSKGQPNDHYHHEDCVKLYQHSSTWNDVSCGSNYSYICKKPADLAKAEIGTESKCPAGWKEFDNSCYKLSTTPLPFTEAQKACAQHTSKKGKAGSLAAVSNRAANFMLTGMAFGRQENTSSQIWIGLTDSAEEGVYSWTSKQPVTFVGWGSGQPSESFSPTGRKGMKNCVTLRAANGHWYDTSCSAVHNYICMTDDADGKPIPASPTKPVPVWTSPCETGWFKHDSVCYGFFGSITNATMQMVDPVITPQSWVDAEAQCARRGAHLASFHDTSTQDWVAKMFDEKLESGVFAYWIGLSQLSQTQGGYQWTDASPLDYTRWAPFEPNDRRGSEDCVEVIVSHHRATYNWRWNDYRCTSRRSFVCAKTPGTKYDHPTPKPTPQTPVGMTKVSCPPGWIQTVDACYRLVQKPLSWTFAGRKCTARSKSKGVPEGVTVSLASIHNSDDHILLAEHIMEAAATLDNVTNYWIGLNDRNNESWFVWSDESPGDYLPWGAGEPNNYYSKQDCGQIKGAYGYLFNDADCSRQFNYVCGYSRYQPGDTGKTTCATDVPCHTECPANWKRNGDSCYLAIDTKMDFDEATLNCSGYNVDSEDSGDLVTINSNDENKWLTRTFFTKDDYYWIGLSDEDQEDRWRWGSGQKVLFTNWNSGQPNNNYGRDSGENCGAADGKSGGKWFDRPCDYYYKFVCEMPVMVVNDSVTTPSHAPASAAAVTTTTATVTTTGGDGKDAASTNNKRSGLSPVATALIGVLCTLLIMALIIGAIVLFYRHRQRVNSGLAGTIGFRRLNVHDDEEDDDKLLVD
ncbi:secretory phospholipase A2 receptor-like isoform X1 [Sycon ciliatum]|uniref:secretory phospholipase A2 receptor-like isoform X1 n=1 Tax=Sycon ciliatum TaxID=27933 RepID=UPI0031F67A32